MPGIGAILGGFGQAYPQFEQQQQQQQMNQAKLQQMLREISLQQQNRQAQTQAIQAMSKAHPSGPGGSYTPQQISQFTSNPDAFNSLMGLLKPTIQGGYNLAGRDVSGQYGNDRAQIRNEGNADVANIRNEGNLATQNARNSGNLDVQDLRSSGNMMTQALRNTGNKAVANIRNERPTAAAAASAVNTPEYKTAKAEYDQAKQDERAIERNYQMNPGQAYNDPQWLDARKRSMAAQQKMEAIQTKVAKQAAQAPAPQQPTTATPGGAAAGGMPKVSSDDDYNKLPSGQQFVDPEGNIRTKP